MSVRLGLIGAGTIGKKHVEASIGSAAKFVTIADPELARAEEVAGLCGARAIDDTKRLIEDPDLDAVVICVPNHLHRPLAEASLRAGKDVLLEKPMAMNVAECDQIIEAAEQNRRVLQLGLVHRYTAVGQAAKSIAETSELGNVYHAKAALYLRRGVPGLGGWFTTRSKSGGGALIDLGVHLLDLALHILNFPEPQQMIGQVYSNFGRRMRDYVYENMWAGPPNYDGVCDVDDAAHAMIRFSNGQTLELNVTWAGNFPAETLPESLLGFFGDRAGMTFQLFGDHLRLAKEEFQRNVDTKMKLPPVDALQQQLADFVRAVETRHVTGATGQQARAVQSIIDAIYQDSKHVASE